MTLRCRELLLTILVSVTARSLHAQRCDSVTSRTSLAELAGRQIGSIRVVPLAPLPFPGPARVLEHLHVRTKQSTVRRQLLIAAGDAIDTLRVAESLRQLRRLPYIADAELTAVACGTKPVDLTIVTRDEWSTRPSMQVRSAWSAFELTERNLFGSGRQATLGIHSALGRTGVGVALRDPWFLGSPFAVELGRYAYQDGSELAVSIARRDRSVLDRWGFEAQFDRSLRAPTGPDTDAVGHALAKETFRRTSLSTLVPSCRDDSPFRRPPSSRHKRARNTGARNLRRHSTPRSWGQARCVATSSPQTSACDGDQSRSIR
jgi:hypothetical protein